MARTVRLNHEGSLYVTTYFGGRERGRCYDFTMIKDGEKVERSFNEEQMFEFLCGEGLAHRIGPDDGQRPAFDA